MPINPSYVQSTVENTKVTPEYLQIRLLHEVHLMQCYYIFILHSQTRLIQVVSGASLAQLLHPTHVLCLQCHSLPSTPQLTRATSSLGAKQIFAPLQTNSPALETTDKGI